MRTVFYLFIQDDNDCTRIFSAIYTLCLGSHKPHQWQLARYRNNQGHISCITIAQNSTKSKAMPKTVNEQVAKSNVVKYSCMKEFSSVLRHFGRATIKIEDNSVHFEIRRRLIA